MHPEDISGEENFEGEARSFLHNIPLQRQKVGKSARELEGDFYIKSRFPKCKKASPLLIDDICLNTADEMKFWKIGGKVSRPAAGFRDGAEYLNDCQV